MIETHGDDVHIHGERPVVGTVRPVGSKSLTNRALVCAALADGVTTLIRPSQADDARVMRAGLEMLGIEVEADPAGQALRVRGCRGLLPEQDVTLNVGAAGTAMRFLTALCTLGQGRYVLDGSPRMRQRPIGPLVGCLAELGAGIGYAEQPGYPPVTMVTHGLRGGQVTISRPQSSQFVSALLMVAPYAANDVFVEILGELPSVPYVEMTIALMRRFGVEVLSAGSSRFVVAAGQRYQACELEIEPDASAATYFWAAAAISGGRVCVAGLSPDSLQGDVGFAEVLARMGCAVERTADGLAVAAPSGARLRAIDIDLNAMPDTVQTLAVVALFTDGTTHIHNVANLRIKETDRLEALATELRKLGATVKLTNDAIAITPPQQIGPAVIDTYDDHRMAMSFALAGLGGADVTIRAAGCVSKSYPAFLDDLRRLIARSDTPSSGA